MWKGCFTSSEMRFHSKNPSARTRHLRFWRDWRNIGFEVISSDFALIGAIFGLSDFSQNGISPHFIVFPTAFPSWLREMMGRSCEGQALKLAGILCTCSFVF